MIEWEVRIPDARLLVNCSASGMLHSSAGRYDRARCGAPCRADRDQECLREAASVVRPTIEAVFLFDAQALVNHLRKRGVKIGIATSVVQEEWRQAEIYPTRRNPALVLSGEQRRLLALFR